MFFFFLLKERDRTVPKELSRTVITSHQQLTMNKAIYKSSVMCSFYFFMRTRPPNPEMSALFLPDNWLFNKRTGLDLQKNVAALTRCHGSLLSWIILNEDIEVGKVRCIKYNKSNMSKRRRNSKYTDMSESSGRCLGDVIRQSKVAEGCFPNIKSFYVHDSKASAQHKTL